MFQADSHRSRSKTTLSSPTNPDSDFCNPAAEPLGDEPEMEGPDFQKRGAPTADASHAEGSHGGGRGSDKTGLTVLTVDGLQ